MKRRVRRGRKKGLSKRQTNAVKSIVKRTLNRNIETKFFPYVATAQLSTYGSIVSWNLFYHGVSAGTGNNALIGDKLNWRGICIKYQLSNRFLDTQWNYNAQPVLIEIMLIETDTYKTSASLAITDFANPTTNDPAMYFVDGATKVLAKKTLSIKPDVFPVGSGTAQRVTLNGKMWVKRNQIIEFNDLSKDYTLSKGKSYYFVVLHKSLAAEKCTIDFTWQNYFKDAQWDIITVFTAFRPLRFPGWGTAELRRNGPIQGNEREARMEQKKKIYLIKMNN